LEDERKEKYYITGGNGSFRTSRKRNNKRGLKIWIDEISQIIYENKQADLKYLSNKTQENRAEYTRLNAIIRQVTKLKKKSLQQHVTHLQYDLRGRQEKAFKVGKELNKEEKRYGITLSKKLHQ
jgi:hypothetical protein